MGFVIQTEYGITPGPLWNELVAEQRKGAHHTGPGEADPADLARALGAFVGAASSIAGNHAGMLEQTASTCVRETKPPFSHQEETAFREGVMSQYGVAISSERVVINHERASQGGN